MVGECPNFAIANLHGNRPHILALFHGEVKRRHYVVDLVAGRVSDHHSKRLARSQ